MENTFQQIPVGSGSAPALRLSEDSLISHNLVVVRDITAYKASLVFITINMLLIYAIKGLLTNLFTFD